VANHRPEDRSAGLTLWNLENEMQFGQEKYLGQIHESGHHAMFFKPDGLITASVSEETRTAIASVFTI
jgi:hypothetical protein